MVKDIRGWEDITTLVMISGCLVRGMISSASCSALCDDTNALLHLSVQETYSFSVTEGLHVSGTSPEMLSNFLSEFVECGTHFARLTHFSQPPVLNSFYTGGLVFQAFAKAIRKFLSHFTAAVLKIPTGLPLLRLNVYMRKAVEQIRYVFSCIFSY